MEARRWFKTYQSNTNTKIHSRSIDQVLVHGVVMKTCQTNLSTQIHDQPISNVKLIWNLLVSWNRLGTG